MSLFPDTNSDVLYLSRSDYEEQLGCFSAHSFSLDGDQWPTVEHYYQAAKFTHNPTYRQKIMQAKTPDQARKLGQTWLRRKRGDWKAIRETMMTRAVYIKCRTHPDIAAALLQTGTTKLVENSLYDYYWGCGRDQRGENRYGTVLMNVRTKLQQEASAASEPSGT